MALRIARIASIAFAAALAILPAAAGAQTTYPGDPRLDSQGAANPEQGRDANRPIDSVSRIPSTARPAPAPWRIVPRISIAETYSDNVTRAPPALARSGWVSALSPGVRVEGGGGRVRGFFDYQLNDFVYSNQSRLNNTQNQLNSQMTVEAIDDWLFLDARARVLQLNRSAFAPTTTQATGANTNRVETSVFQLSPFVRGAISDAALYQVRYNGTTSRTSDGAIPGTRTSEWVGRIKNAPSTSLLGWSVDGSSLTLRNSLVGSKDDSRIRGSLLYALYPELHLSLFEGFETTDFASTTRQQTATSGFGVEWTPGARTQVAAITEKRFFGNSHSVLLSHRTPLMALRFTDDKDVSVLPVQLASGGQGSIYGLLYDLLASSTPDPTARAAAVRTQLERTGTPDGSPAGAGFLTSGATLVQRREASVTLLGKTNTVTFAWSRREYHAVGGSLGLVGNTNGTLNLSQQGYNASWTHQLTPRSSITLLDSHLETRDLNANGFASKLHSQDLLFLTQLGPRTSLSVGGRRVRFESSAVTGYSENALLGTASWRF